MLATLVIGLREGLEAALIVGIIAAFLRNNGKSLAAMWLGVILAVLLSIAVGVGLALLEQALPQAAQEGLETVIGAVAVFFVTGMIVWMNTHARDMKRQLENEAAHALGRASTYALASMAFLAVLKEGFETSVFLLATFSAAQSTTLAASGAIIGLLVAVAIGWGIYTGGVKLNLGQFFRYTAAFLILVAAGLVVSCLRTAHEAGWLNAGQQAIMNLDWLIAHGTVQSALITGVLGIPADPRLIEILGWLAYLIPVALYLYWPRAHRPGLRAAARLKIAVAASLALAALGSMLFYPHPQPNIPSRGAPIASNTSEQSTMGTARLTPAADDAPATLHVQFDDSTIHSHSLPLPTSESEQRQHSGLAASTWKVTQTRTPAAAPTTLTLEQVVKLAGGRLPIGLNPRQYPGPFTAQWTVHSATRVWRADGILLDARGRNVTTIALSGSGLQTPRTFTVRNADHAGPASKWRIASAYVDHVSRELNTTAAARMERRFWAVRLPVLLLAAALVLILFAWHDLVRSPAVSKAANTPSDPKTGRRAAHPDTKGATHAA